jgi:hypothetical protein
MPFQIFQGVIVFYGLNNYFKILVITIFKVFSRGFFFKILGYVYQYIKNNIAQKELHLSFFL